MTTQENQSEEVSVSVNETETDTTHSVDSNSTQKVDNEDITNSIAPASEDAGKVEDAWNGQDSQASEIDVEAVSRELDELFAELSADEAKTETKEDPFYSKPDSGKEESPETKEEDNASQKEIESLKAELSAKESELKEKESKAAENEKLIAEASEMWTNLLEHPQLWPLIKKWSNGEPIDLAWPVLEAMKEKNSSMESTISTGSQAELPKWQLSLQEQMSLAKRRGY